MRVLSVTHEPAPTGGGGSFEERVRARGDELTVWLTPEQGLPGRPA